ncbi:hypothetical protein [Tautonia marina]|uniref:hypothetical protein n=1 Tax=Tautonia marina TaxID=2653855 RepID=UPI00126076FD|nr:hypothetical protein [Tautonia marina]
MTNERADQELARLLAMSEEERERYFCALPPDGTSTLLVEHLLTKPQTAARDELIKRAKAYWYDDFKSLNPSGCPKMTLHDDLMRAGYGDLAANVVGGLYD